MHIQKKIEHFFIFIFRIISLIVDDDIGLKNLKIKTKMII